ncbi:MAG: acetamidase/formamidase family protein [Fretibacterium sp.]|nr:acetamidase/formamidase family protein [Fretibacterium sp.]
MRIAADQYVLDMSSKHPAVAEVASGSKVTFETKDCFSNTIVNPDHLFSSVGWDKINPATGPLKVTGAEPGDVLKVEILDIRVAEQGVMTTAPGFGALGDEMEREVTKVIKIEGDEAVFNDRIRLPLAPMIGVIGTAPAGDAIPTGTPGEHGGNMDCKRIVKGSILYLPVAVSGAMLAMGDLHAIMGDGEIVVCGVEIAGEVDVRVSVLKNPVLPTPFLIEGGSLMTIASAKTLDEAAVVATRKMHRFLRERLKIENHEAGMLLSAVGDLRICQIVDPLMTARMEFPQKIAELYSFKLD